MTFITMSASAVKDLATKRLMEKAEKRNASNFSLSVASATENRCRKLLVLTRDLLASIQVNVDVEDYYALVVSDVDKEQQPKLEGYGLL